jgi:lysophospholipase L1-like esterase
MNKDKIILIGSSMAMPRIEVSYEETWPYKLQNHFSNDYFFIDKCKRASSTVRLVKEGSGKGDKIGASDLLEYYSPKIVITQIGIVDCAPRLIKRYSPLVKLINVSPSIIKRTFYSILKKTRIRSVKFADLSVNEFRSNWESFIIRALQIEAQIICVLISEPSNTVTEKSPEIKKAIDIYNDILLDLDIKYSNFTTLKAYSQTEIKLTSLDEFHVNNEGHDILFNKLKQLIQGILLKK